MQNYTATELVEIIREAKAAARAAAEKYYNEKLGGEDRWACGFAWVDIWGVKGNTKLGKAMTAAGLRKAYNGAYQIWNPSELHCQNVDTKFEGALAAQNVFRKYGFDKAYADSRLD